MRSQATFYHAGCPVCVDAERQLAHALDPSRYRVEVVHLGQAKGRLDEAQRAGWWSTGACTTSTLAPRSPT
jgi:hypothetical protein